MDNVDVKQEQVERNESEDDDCSDDGNATDSPTYIPQQPQDSRCSSKRKLKSNDKEDRVAKVLRTEGGRSSNGPSPISDPSILCVAEIGSADQSNGNAVSDSSHPRDSPPSMARSASPVAGPSKALGLRHYDLDVDNSWPMNDSVVDTLPKNKRKIKEREPIEDGRCKCMYNCNLISDEERTTLRERYDALPDWNSRSIFLASCLTVVPVSYHRNTPHEKQRQRSVHYTIGGTRVCKKTLANTFGVSFSRLSYLYRNKLGMDTTIISLDKRGSNSPAHKVPDCDLARIHAFFNSFPKYKSLTQSSKIYFPPHLNKSKMYQIFFAENPNLKLSKFILNREFFKQAVTFYIPHKDKCEECENYKIVSKSCEDLDLNKLAEHETHLTFVRSAKDKLKNAEKLARLNNKLLCFTYGFQKAQPIPYLNINVVHYKRQLWMYNFGINTRHDNKGYIFSWTEVEGKRGGMEIISSVNDFLFQNVILSNIDEIHTFSDRTDGIDFNYVVFYMVYIAKRFRLKWRHTFLECGHAYLPNDTDFGKIDKAKNNRCLYMHEHYMDLCQRECDFSFSHMKGKIFDFSALSTCHRFCLDREDGLDWLEVRDLIVPPDSRIIHYTYSHAPEAKWLAYDIGECSHESFVPLQLYDAGLKVTKKKYEDVLSLLKYIPTSYHEALKSIPHEVEPTSDGHLEVHPDLFRDILN